MRRIVIAGLATLSCVLSPQAFSRDVASKVSKYYVYRSVNSGVSWIPAKVGPPRSKRINALAVDTAMSYAGTDEGIFVSSDDGETWSRVAAGPESRVQSLLATHRAVYAGTNQGVYISRDRGRTWESWSRGLTDVNVRTLATDGTIILAGTDKHGVFVLSGEGKWEKFGTGLPSRSQVFDLAATPSHIYAALYGKGLYRNDTGRVWEKVGEVKPLEVLARGDVIVAGHNPGGIQQSTDKGKTWQAAAGLSGRAPIWVLGEAGRIFFAGTTPGAVVRSEDAGASWQPGSLGLPSGSAVVAVTGSTSVAIAAIVVEDN